MHLLRQESLVCIFESPRLVLLCTIHVFHTIRVWYIPYAYTHMVQPYAYGMAICTYAYSFTILLLFTRNIYIAITNIVLLFVLDHVHSAAICSDALRRLMHSDKLIISGLANNPNQIWPAAKVTGITVICS